MSPSSVGALAVSRRVLSTLLVLNVLYGLGILALLVASLIAPDWVFRALGVKAADLTGALVRGMRLIMVVGILSAPIAHVILRRLLAMVDTVRAGDPFVVENADRLQLIAWCVLGLELLHLAVGAIAFGWTSAKPIDMEWSFSLTPWIAVLLLFVLARVFDHGARMRADLEGTI